MREPDGRTYEEIRAETDAWLGHELVTVEWEGYDYLKCRDCGRSYMDREDMIDNPFECPNEPIYEGVFADDPQKIRGE